ncbi:unnamed protein product [Alternaria burnsii]|nr:unnamed protein product [Alternaria burnsii]
MMHSSSQRVQGTNLLQLPASHRHQGFGAETINVDDYVMPICKSDTAVVFELCCFGRVFVAKAELEQSVKGKSTEKDSLSGVSPQKCTCSSQHGQRPTGLVLPGRLDTLRSRAAFGSQASQAIQYLQDGARLSPLVRSRFEVENTISLLLWG